MENRELAIKIARLMDTDHETTEEFAQTAINVFALLDSGEYKLVLEQVLMSMDDREYYFQSTMESFMEVAKELLHHLQNAG